MSLSGILRYKLLLPVVTAAIALAPLASTQAQSSDFGTVEVQLSFPSDFTPAMKLCAQSTTNYYLLNCIDTEEGPPGITAEITVRPGEYFIFATVLGERTVGGDLFTLYHAEVGREAQPIPVSVSANETVTGVSTSNEGLCFRNPKPAYCVEPPQ